MKLLSVVRDVLVMIIITVLVVGCLITSIATTGWLSIAALAMTIVAGYMLGSLINQY